MSSVIQPIVPISVSDADQPTAGSTSQASSGESFVITDPNSGTTSPVTIETPSTGIIQIAAGTEGANIIVEGNGTAGVTIGNANTAAGAELSASGTIFQIADNYQGTTIANLEGAIVDGTKVDLNTAAVGGGTIASNLSGSTNIDIDYYVNTGAANDQVSGTQGGDFIRAGAGDDVVNAGAGNDVVRLGSGNDTATLGSGDDVALFTVDQLQGDQIKTITDFDASGNDKIQIDADLEGLIDIEGTGTNSIVISLSGDQTGTTAIISEGETIDDDDIEFV